MNIGVGIGMEGTLGGGLEGGLGAGLLPRPLKLGAAQIPGPQKRAFPACGRYVSAFLASSLRPAALSLRTLCAGAFSRLPLHLLCLFLLAFLVAERVQADVFSRPCRLFGVEPALAMAIARVESGWHPWCVNVAGKDHYPQSLEEAARLARTAMGEGKSVDVGLMQINSWWLKKWGISPERALVPSVNANLGLLVLAYEMRRHGPTWKAVGRYHSPDARRQARYVQKVAKAREAIVAAMARAAVAGAGPGQDGTARAARKVALPRLKDPLPNARKEGVPKGTSAHETGAKGTGAKETGARGRRSP